MKLYMAVTQDEYELPIAVCTSVQELARKCGVKENTISHTIALYKKRKPRYKKYVVVEV